MKINFVDPTVVGFRGSCPRKQASKDHVPKDIDVLTSSENVEKIELFGLYGYMIYVLIIYVYIFVFSYTHICTYVVWLCKYV